MRKRISLALMALAVLVAAVALLAAAQEEPPPVPPATPDERLARVAELMEDRGEPGHKVDFVSNLRAMIAEAEEMRDMEPWDARQEVMKQVLDANDDEIVQIYWWLNRAQEKQAELSKRLSRLHDAAGELRDRSLLYGTERPKQ